MVLAVRGDYLQTVAPINSKRLLRPAAEYRDEVVGITTYDLDGDGSGLGVTISMPAICRACSRRAA